MRKRKRTNEVFGVTAEQNGTAPSLDAEKVLKDYIDVLYYERKQRANLLGKFDENGQYKIDDEIILQELVKVSKKFEEKTDNVVRASIKISSLVLNFKITFDIAESYCNATLDFVEIEQGVEEDIKHITHLDSLVEPYSPNFQQNAYKKWNVVFEEEQLEKDEFLEEILLRQKQESDFNKELIEILSQLYLVRMLKLLDASGELGEKIKLEYKKIVELLLAKNPALTQDNTRLKMILDSIIVKNKAFAVLVKSDEGAKILAGYSLPIQRVRGKSPAVVIASNAGKTEEKKTDKKAEAKKSASKPAKKKAKASAKSKSNVKAAKIDWGKLPKITGGAPKTFELPKTPTPKNEPPKPTTEPKASDVSQDEVAAMEAFKNRQKNIDKSLNSSTVGVDYEEVNLHGRSDSISTFSNNGISQELNK